MTGLTAGLQVIPLDATRDTRGFAVAPITDTDLASGRAANLHVVSMHPGAVRGNHRHEGRTETVCVLAGTVLARFEDAEGAPAEHRVEAGHPVAFRIPPGVAHAFCNEGPDTAVLLSYSDRPFHPADTSRAALIAP